MLFILYVWEIIQYSYVGLILHIINIILKILPYYVCRILVNILRYDVLFPENVPLFLVRWNAHLLCGLWWLMIDDDDDDGYVGGIL